MQESINIIYLTKIKVRGRMENMTAQITKLIFPIIPLFLMGTILGMTAIFLPDRAVNFADRAGDYNNLQPRRV